MAVPEGFQEGGVQLRPAAHDAAVHTLYAQMEGAVDVLLPGIAFLTHGIAPGLLLQNDFAVLIHTEDQNGRARVHESCQPAVFYAYISGEHDVVDVVGLHDVVQLPDIVGLAVKGHALRAEQVGDIFFCKLQLLCMFFCVRKKALRRALHQFPRRRLHGGVQRRGEAHRFLVHQRQRPAGQAGTKIALQLQRHRVAGLGPADDLRVDVLVAQDDHAGRGEFVQDLLRRQTGDVGVHPADIAVHRPALHLLLPRRQLLRGQLPVLGGLYRVNPHVFLV